MYLEDRADFQPVLPFYEKFFWNVFLLLWTIICAVVLFERFMLALMPQLYVSLVIGFFAEVYQPLFVTPYVVCKLCLDHGVGVALVFVHALNQPRYDFFIRFVPRRPIRGSLHVCLFCCACALSGAHGEWTNSDDVRPVVTPEFVPAATRPDATRADREKTRVRNIKEGHTSNQHKRENFTSSKLERCAQCLPTGRSCPNMFARTRRKKMCRECFERLNGREEPLSLFGSDNEDDTVSVSASSEATEPELDIREKRLYTIGTRGVRKGFASFAYAFLMFWVYIVVSVGFVCVSFLVHESFGCAAIAFVVTRYSKRRQDGGSRRDPRHHPTHSNISDGYHIHHTTDEMLYLGYGGYIVVPILWSAVLWLREHKRVKVVRNNTATIVAYLNKQFPGIDDPTLLLHTAAYFLQELELEEVFFDHHSAALESRRPPSYPDGHWRPN